MKRKWNLDVLRIVSMAAVVILHTAAQYWWDSNRIYGFTWEVVNLYNNAVRWGVPVFVMISGALFLDPAREQTIRKLYSKNILRIVWILLFWGLVYALLYNPPQDLTLQDFLVFLKAWILGHNHMWFLYMIIGLYMITPLLRRITSSDILTRYALLLGLVFAIVIPFVTSFGHLSILSNLQKQLMISFPVGYVFYFVLGYWLTTLKFDKKMVVVFALIGIAGIALSTALTAWATLSLGEPTEIYYRNVSLPVCMASVGIFIVGLQIKVKGDRAKSTIRTISGASLGVYMVHIIVLERLSFFGINSMMFSPILAVPVTALIATVISFAISVLIAKIPFIGKRIV